MRTKSPTLVVAITVVLATLAEFSGTATAGSRGASAESCRARPVVQQFIDALGAGDTVRLEQLFAQKGAGWNWYSVSDRAGQRLRAESKRRTSLIAYFATRMRQHEQLRLLRFDENGNGNFAFLLERRADDLHEGEPVGRLGKGRVSCATGQIGVWSLGGAPAPRSFGPCPQAALPLATTDLPGASRAVLAFVRDTYSGMSPGLNVEGARVTYATLAPGNVKGYAARIRCGHDVQRRTAVIEIRFPRVASRERVSSIAFYASRTQRGWLVWSLIQ